jgi:hypothetical protein
MPASSITVSSSALITSPTCYRVRVQAGRNDGDGNIAIGQHSHWYALPVDLVGNNQPTHMTFVHQSRSSRHTFVAPREYRVATTVFANVH